MVVVKRTRLDPAQRREQLIELGVKMMSERGLDRISVEEIAEEAGISRGLLFHYFATKRDFHLAIVTHSTEEMLARTEPLQGLHPIATLRDAMERYVDYVTENRDSYLSLLRGSASADPDMVAVFEWSRTTIVERILGNLPIPVEIDSGELALAVRGWIAFVEEATISWLRDPQQVSRETLIELQVRALPAVALGPDAATMLLASADVEESVATGA